MRVNIEQGSECWHFVRTNKIGCSEVAAILGLSPYKTAMGVYREKMGLDTPFYNDHMRRGNEMEPVARDMFNNLYGYNCKPTVFVSDEHNWLMASLDGFDDFHQMGVEIKCPSKLSEDGIPKIYQVQMQFQMFCSELSEMHYFEFIDNDNFKQEILIRDDQFITENLEKVKKFWDDLQNFVEPSLQEMDYVDKSGDSSFCELEYEYISIEDQIKLLQERQEKLREEIIEKCEDQRCRGKFLTVSKGTRKGTINYASIPFLKGVDLEQYRKPGSNFWIIKNRG